jgi:hypothetical protein
VAFVQKEPTAFLVREEGFNGLITNDKFCMVRTGKLKLNHWRLRIPTKWFFRKFRA